MLEQLSARVLNSATRSSGCRFDAYRIDDTFHIDIELPGVDPADIDISVEEKVLTVRAARRHGNDENKSRQVLLADRLDTDRLEARYDDGVLTVSIPVKDKLTV